MNNNSWFKKEKPMVTLPGLGGGSASNLYWRPAGGGGGSSNTYIDDVFSMYLYKGDGQTNRVINNGIKIGNANAGNSVDFNGSSDYLSIADSTDFDLASVDFTMECWYYPRSNPSWVGLLAQWPNGNYNTTNSWTLEPVGSSLNFYYCMTNGTLSNIAAPGSLSLNQWHHCAIVKKNNQLKCFLNGSGSSWSTINGTLQNSTEPLTIGGLVAPSSGSGWANGRISNVRITKGQCLYENNFTPSTDPLTTTSQSATASNVKLLCCNSSNITGATVTPSSIRAHSLPKSSDGPFTASDGEGALIWSKARTSGSYTEHGLIDTVRGAGYELQSNSDAGHNYHAQRIHTFDNSGYVLGTSMRYNATGMDYVSWTWRKAPGFCDIISYSGSGSYKTVNHNLGCIPGMYMIKRTDTSGDWRVFHRSLNGPAWRLVLNSDETQNDLYSLNNNTGPTSSVFSVGSDSTVNASGGTYICYLFAGGESDESTAKCTDFNGNNEILYVNDSSAFNMGTSDYTVECWIKLDGTNGNLDQNSCVWCMDNYQTGPEVYILSNGKIGLYSHQSYLMQSDTGKIVPETWHHIAVSRSSGTARLFVDGDEIGSGSEASITANSFYIGCERSNSGGLGSFVDGKVSNLRVVKGTAVYTSWFRPPTKPLENISNTELLCCNASTATGGTVSPGTINASGTPTGEVDSPFDDPNGFIFGKNGDQNLIKCGSFHVPSGGKQNIDLGWEPQWWLWKKCNGSGGWGVYDAMRGVVSGGNDYYLELHNNNQENNVDVLTFNPTGVEINLSGHVGSEFIFMAVRRPDGYVGKPPTVASDVFSMNTGNATAESDDKPTFVSGFPVDFALRRMPTGGSGTDMDWVVYNRLNGGKYLRTNTADTESQSSRAKWDLMTGFNHTDGNTYQAWMFKRHAGMDVISDIGDGQTTKEIAHSLGVVPQMIWRKNRDNGDNWQVYHFGVNSGTNPHLYRLRLNTNNMEDTDSYTWVNAPTATHFTVGSNGSINRANEDFLNVLFASVDGISKVGTYNGSSSTQTITCGFRPRFFWQKRVSGTGEWHTCDTLRGWGPGSDQFMYFDGSNGQAGYDFGEPTATGFTINGGADTVSNTGQRYIFYAHA